MPCRDEFPLLEAKLAEHAADGLAVVGVLTDDPLDAGPRLRRRVRRDVADRRSTRTRRSRRAYRVAGRPQTYFVDRDGVIRSIQIGELTDADFERQYARIAP